MARLAEDGREVDRVHPLAPGRRAARRVHAARARPASCATRVKSYRAGYLAEDRRELERQLADDELIAVASTNALELGIDIGSLDAAVLVGYPGTRASMWQQAGRAGRRADGSLAVLVAQDDPLDQYLVTHPADLFDKPAEAAVIDPSNPFVLGAPPRVRGARVPAVRGRARVLLARRAGRAVERLEERGRARPPSRAHATTWDASSPHRAVDIRSAGGRPVLDRDRGHRRAARHGRRVAGVLPRAPRRGLPAPGRAVRGRASSTWPAGVALVTASDPDYYTQSRDTTDIDVGRGRRGGATDRRRADVLRHRARHATRSSGSSASTSRRARSLDDRPARAAAADARDEGRVVGHPARGDRAGGDHDAPTCPARRTRPSTPRSACCRSSRRATGGTSAASRPRTTRTPARARSSSTTATRAAPASPSAGSASARALAARRRSRPSASCPCSARLPVVRAVAQVRQRERAARQGRAPSRCSPRCWAGLRERTEDARTG